MATWREMRLFCKRHQAVMFCVYVAAIYVILNVFVAEKNVSLLRFQRTDGSNLDDFIDGDDDVGEFRKREVDVSGGRSHKRNNINDLRFVKEEIGNVVEDDDSDDAGGNAGDDDVGDIGGDDDDGGGLLMVDEGGGMKNVGHGGDADFGDEFYQGYIEGYDDINDLDEKNIEMNNLPKNEFHEERDDDVEEDEVKRNMLRGKLERFKKLDELVKEEKREFGAYWEKVNKDKEEKKKNMDEKGDANDDDDDANEEDNDESDEDIAEDESDNDEAKNENLEIVGEDNEKDDKIIEVANKNEKEHGEGPNIIHIDNKVDEDKKGDGKLSNDTPDTKENKNGALLKKKSGKGKSKKKRGGKKRNKDDKSALGLKNKSAQLESNPVLDIVMAQLEKDKLDTIEIDLSALNKTIEDTKLPHFVEYGKEGDPGQNSTKYEFPPMPKEMEEKRKEDYTKNYFDLWVSNKIAVHRSLNDPRSEKCCHYQYNITTYPAISIIIVFHNEAWTTLLRTLHSILDRTPAYALMEIILLDDFSDDADMKEPLEVYVKSLKVVRLIRASARLGLIKARNLGFLYSKGEIIIFLDSHIECFDGWLEPLISPIIHDHKTVTFPIIDIIDKDNFGISLLPANNVGTLNFAAMSFTWERSEEKDLWYYRSPTMPGGLYAISRKWFYELGAYDPGLKLWGGENLEISFKIWMCGGTLLASACSHVGHVFRTKSPNKDSDFTHAIRTNTFRLAEVWLDNYKHFYYEKLNYKVADYGDVTNQKALRKSLHCVPFAWYLSEINPHLKEQIGAGGNYSGLITNRGTGMCLQADFRLITVRKCDMMNFGQMWQLSPKGILSTHEYDMYVMEFASRHKDTNVTSKLYSVKVRSSRTEKREENAIFSYNKNNLHLVHEDTEQCLDVEPSGSRSIRLSPCHPKAPIQKWELMTRKELQAYHKNKRKVEIDWSV